MPDIRDHGGSYGGRSPNLKPENIKKGINISGVVGTVEPLGAGDTLVHSNDGGFQTNAGQVAPIVVKETRVAVGGTYRVRFDLKHYGTTATTSYARIYVNGTARGTLRSSSNTSGQTTYTEDITVQANDLVQVYGYSSTTSYNLVVSNFRFYITTLTFTNLQ